jgi:hypothetical protein
LAATAGRAIVNSRTAAGNKLAIVLEIFMGRYLLNVWIQITKWRRR